MIIIWLELCLQFLLGNDINLGGISGVGPASLSKKITKMYTDNEESNKEVMINHMLNWMESKLSPVNEISHLKIYAESFIYKPEVEDNIRPKKDYY